MFEPDADKVAAIQSIRELLKDKTLSKFKKPDAKVSVTVAKADGPQEEDAEKALLGDPKDEVAMGGPVEGADEAEGLSPEVLAAVQKALGRYAPGKG